MASVFIQDPTLPAGFSLRLRTIFWSKVNKNGPIPNHLPHLGNCWPWMGCIAHKTGYGNIRCGRRPGVLWLAHRLSWLLHYGTIDESLHVCHHCDNRACVRPDHLFQGTDRDNLHDMINKGRNNPPRGERHRDHKFTIEQVASIRLRCAAGETQRAIAREFGVANSSINRLVHGEHWKILPMQESGQE